MIIENGEIWQENAFQKASLSVKNGLIDAILPPSHSPSSREDQVVDAAGCLILPGGIDLHAHIQDGAESFFAGSCAAVKGGITTVVDMPPFQTVLSRAQWLKRAAWANRECVSDVGFTGGIVIHQKDLDHLDELCACGVSQFKVFMLSRPSDELLWQAVQTAARMGLRLAVHMEEPALLREVDWSDPLGFYKANPAEAENVAVARMLEMAHAAGAAIHVCHVSSARSAELIDQYKGWGTAVTAETTPHYLILNQKNITDFPERAIVTPALREERDNEVLWQALEDGVIDILVSDHFLGAIPDPSKPRPAPKDAEPGIAGLEVSMPLIYTFGVQRGKLSMQRFVEAFSLTPAMLAGIADQKGSLHPGLDADLVLFDPARVWDVQPRSKESRITTLPYEGWQLQGAVRQTWVRGKEVWNGNEITCKAGWGCTIPKGILESINCMEK